MNLITQYRLCGLVLGLVSRLGSLYIAFCICIWCQVKRCWSSKLLAEALGISLQEAVILYCDIIVRRSNMICILKAVVLTE